MGAIGDVGIHADIADIGRKVFIASIGRLGYNVITTGLGRRCWRSTIGSGIRAQRVGCMVSHR